MNPDEIHARHFGRQIAAEMFGTHVLGRQVDEAIAVEAGKRGSRRRTKTYD